VDCIRRDIASPEHHFATRVGLAATQLVNHPGFETFAQPDELLVTFWRERGTVFENVERGVVGPRPSIAKTSHV